ncbi:MAG: OmpA family protein [Mycobacterium sp.]|nr:OmpA family protein [Mycobacterium sp.]
MLGGDLPDEPTKAALLKALTGSLGPGMNVLDHINIDPNVDSLDFSNAGTLFNDSAPIADFHFAVDGGTIALAGTAASQDQKNKVEHDAATTWPGVKVVDNLIVVIVNGPAATRAAPCADLQSAIDTAMGGPVTFGSDGFSLTPADEQTLTQVADKLKACPAAQATINGYSDDAGAEPVNIAMSSRRAQKVADFLTTQGVAADHLVIRGLGSVNPVAANDTAVGRARNRRVEIAVG